MTTTANRSAGRAPRRSVSQAIQDANDAYVASLNLPPLTPTQAGRILGIVARAEERILRERASAPAA